MNATEILDSDVLHIMTQESWKQTVPKTLCGKEVRHLETNEFYTFFPENLKVNCQDCKKKKKKK